MLSCLDCTSQTDAAHIQPPAMLLSCWCMKQGVGSRVLVHEAGSRVLVHEAGVGSRVLVHEAGCRL